MIILDSNGLIDCLKNGKTIPNGELLVTQDLRDEYETALLVNGHQTLELTDSSSLPGYDDASYYKEYKKYLNCFPGVNVASMRSLTDVSILALISCVVSKFGQNQQVRLDLEGYYEEKIIVITNDADLIKQLQLDFKDYVEVINPSSLD